MADAASTRRSTGQASSLFRIRRGEDAMWLKWSGPRLWTAISGWRMFGTVRMCATEFVSSLNDELQHKSISARGKCGWRWLDGRVWNWGRVSADTYVVAHSHKIKRNTDVVNWWGGSWCCHCFRTLFNSWCRWCIDRVCSLINCLTDWIWRDSCCK